PRSWNVPSGGRSQPRPAACPGGRTSSPTSTTRNGPAPEPILARATGSILMPEEATETKPVRRLPVVDVGPRVTARLPPGRLRIELLTDPWSVWCWGFEPVRRALELRHPSLEFRFLLGGMFPQMPRPEESG